VNAGGVGAGGMLVPPGLGTGKNARAPRDELVFRGSSKEWSTPMRLGNFSVSLSVKDLNASRAFYEKIGFVVKGGDGAGFLIMTNEAATIGLFQGMFEGNILTFNPGWDQACNTLPSFDDVREIQRLARERGLKLGTTTDEHGTGPGHITLTDPDGNQILIDQHVGKA
jgi:catechol 2,3-dioxygenase-like lactoylglutathione lyase family enzyme